MKSTGDCYFAAGKYLSEAESNRIDKLTLVHAAVRGNSKLSDMAIGHAWIETDHEGLGICIDPSNGREVVLPAELYRRDRVIEEFRYSHADLCKWSCKTGHWGPWEGMFTNLPRACLPLDEIPTETITHRKEKS